METTQGQPLQYTLPLSQTNMAPPPRPYVKEGYKSKSVRRLAIAQLVLGCLAFGFQLWDTINLSLMSTIGTGMWTGMFFIVTGCFGLVSANQKTVCSIASYMVLSILSSLLALTLLVITSIGLSDYSYCNKYWQYREYNFCRDIKNDYELKCTLFLSSMLVLISVVEGIIAIVAASFTCHGCCSSTPNNGVLSYTTPQQYVHGPNGQLLLVTGQQPNMVSTMTGPQVFIAGNTGNYQAQMNVAVPLPTQQYTAPTMSTQQPMPQPESVPPPAYQTVLEQAAGNQPPQVHQSAENGITNKNYMEN